MAVKLYVIPASHPSLAAELMLERKSEDKVRADLQRLPSLLDEVDRLLAEGVIGGDEPNAADCQIATRVRLLLLFAQLRPLIENRPAGAHAMRIAPVMRREIPASIPPGWLPA